MYDEEDEDEGNFPDGDGYVGVKRKTGEIAERDKPWVVYGQTIDQVRCHKWDASEIKQGNNADKQNAQKGLAAKKNFFHHPADITKTFHSYYFNFTLHSIQEYEQDDSNRAEGDRAKRSKRAKKKKKKQRYWGLRKVEGERAARSDYTRRAER